MAAIDDLLTVPMEHSDTSKSLDNIHTTSVPDIPLGTPPVKSEDTDPTTQEWWSKFASKPASQTTQLEPTTFDWDKSGANIWSQNKHFGEQGFDPYAIPVTKDGITVDANEQKYANAETFGDKAYQGIVGGGSLFLDTFTRQAEQWKGTVNGIWDMVAGAAQGDPGNGWEKAKRDMIGSDQDLMQMNKEQQDIMDRYHIPEGTYEKSHLWSQSMIFDNIQQFGLGAGQGAEMGAEVLATWGIGAAFNAVRAPILAAKSIEGAEVATNLATKTAEASRLAIPLDEQQIAAENLHNVALETQKLNEVSGNHDLMQGLWQTLVKGSKTVAGRAIPGMGIVEGVSDISKGIETTGDITNWSAWKGGVGSIAKEMSLFNMASTHGKLLAFTTYGQQYGDLVNQYEKEHDGQSPDGSELDRIKNNAWMAASDNFSLNLGLIMLMGKIQWGGIYSKFGSVARNLRGLEMPSIEEAGENGLLKVAGQWQKGARYGEGVDVDAFEKTGKLAAKDLGEVAENKIGTPGIKEYVKATGLFPAIRTLNMVKQDFGLGTALWEGAKTFAKSSAGKFELAEIAEGLHLVLQNASDKSFREYYKNQYDGGTDINGHSFIDATKNIDWTESMKKEFALGYDPGGGYKTFVMAFSNGLLMTPIQEGLGYGQNRIMTKVSPAIKEQSEYRKATIAQNAAMMNTWYKDPNSVLNTHIDAIKTAGKASDNMSQSIQEQNKYAFHNAKDDLFAKTVSTFIKNGNYDSFLYTMKNMGKMSEKDFYDAVPNMKPVDGSTPLSPQMHVDNIINDVTEYYNRWQKLTDKYSGLINPQYFEGRGANALKESNEKRDKAHNDLSQEYADTKFGDEHYKLPEDQQKANLDKVNEYNQKSKVIEDTYDNETKGNQYHRQLMKKRALDEAIEVMATTDYQVHRTVQRMAAIKGQMTDSSVVGNSISRHGTKIVDVLGDKKNTAKEILNLQSQINLIEPVSTGKDIVSKDINQQLKAQKEQLAQLLKWKQALDVHESHNIHSELDKGKLKEMGFPIPSWDKNVKNLRDAHNGYINALNEEIAESPQTVSVQDYQKSLQLLTEHMNLQKDHSSYLEALSVLADPHNFQALHHKIIDGMAYAMFDRFVKEKHLIDIYDKINEDTAKFEAEEQEQDNADNNKKLTAEQQKRAADRIERKRLQQEKLEKEKLKLSELLKNAESDLKTLTDTWVDTLQNIEQNDKIVEGLKGDIQAAKELLDEIGNKRTKEKAALNKMALKMQSDLEILKANTIDLHEKVTNLENVIGFVEQMKYHYSRAINEIEQKNRTLGDTHIESLEIELQKVKNDLQGRIDNYNDVIKSTEELLYELFHIPDEKANEETEEQYQDRLKNALDNLSSKFNEQVEPISSTVEFLENRLNYLQFIKAALKEEDEPKPDKLFIEKKEKATTEQNDNTKQEIVNSAISGENLSPEAQEILDNNSDLQTTVNDIKSEVAEINNADYQSVSGSELEKLKADKIEEIKQKAEKEISDAFDNNIEFISHPELEGFPVPKQAEGGWKVSFRGASGIFKLKQQANDFIIREMKEREAPGKQWEKIEGTDFRKGQYIYKAGTRYTITTVPNIKTGYLKITNDAGGEQSIAKGSLKNYSSVNSEQKNENGVDNNKDNPVLYNVDGELTPNDPNKINYDDINSINVPVNTIYKTGLPKIKENILYVENRNQAKERFLKFIADNNITNLNDANIELLIRDNIKYVHLTEKEKSDNPNTKDRKKVVRDKNTIPDFIKTNDNIRVIRWPFTYSVEISVGNKKQGFDLMTNGTNYEFQVSPGEWISADNLTQEQFFKFFNPPTSFFNTSQNSISQSELYTQFKNDIDKVNAFSLEMSKKKVGDTVKGNELHNLVNFEYLPHLNYSGFKDGIERADSPLGELQELGKVKLNGLELPNGETVQRITLNNGLDRADKQFIINGTPEDLAKIEAISPRTNQYPGMYSTCVQLPTGQIIWVELKPALLNKQEVQSRLDNVLKLVTDTKGETKEEVEGGSKEVNDILSSIFIPFNVYNTPREVDYTQKWAIRTRAIRAEDGPNKGFWHITLMMEESFGLPSERGQVFLSLPDMKAVLNSPESFAESMNNAFREKDKTGKLKHESIANLEVDPENLREQVDRNDIDSINKMATNLSVENNSVVKNMNVKWTFSPEVQEVVKISQPRVIKVVLDRIDEKLLTSGGFTKTGDSWTKNGNIINPVEELRKIKIGVGDTAENTSAQETLNNPINNPPVPEEERDLSFDEIEKDLDNQRTAKKVINSNEKFDAVSVENINKFKDWCTKNINPKIISVENLGILIDNLEKHNVTVGTFNSYMDGINQKGKISLYENSPFKYHEAFHAIFRLLLPEQRVQSLLREMRQESIPTHEELQKFREKGYNYNEKDIVDRYLEEKLADKFDVWKRTQKEPNTIIGKFFKYVTDLFRELKAKLFGNKSLGLFYEINRGKYRNANLQENSFIGVDGIAISQPAMKSILLGTQNIGGKTVPRYLPQQTADKLSASIAGLFLQNLDKNPLYKTTGKYNKNSTLDRILDMYAETLDYNKRSEFYNEKASLISNIGERNRWKRELADRYSIFRKTLPDGTKNKVRDDLKESVDQYLKIMGLKQKLDDTRYEEEELEKVEASTENLERTSAFSIGGYGSLPTMVRKLIGTTTFTMDELGRHDEFFNNKFLNGENIVEAVDANKVYNGMLKVLANVSDIDTLLRKMMNYIDDGANPETSKFINTIFKKIGFDPVTYKESNGTIIGNQQQNMLQQIIKAFNQYTVDTVFVGIDGNEYRNTYANVKDASFYQISNWQKAFNDVFYNKYINDPSEKYLIESIKPLQDLFNHIDLTGNSITDAKLKSESLRISQQLRDKLGINFHPSYIKYSILKSKIADGDKLSSLSPSQESFVNSYPLVSAIEPGPLKSIIDQLKSNDKNIFTKDEKGIKNSYQSLNYMADGNTLFDESINMMSHKNAEGENVSNFVQPFYSAVAISDMNKGLKKWLESLPEEFKKEVINNPLLKDANFRYLMDKGWLSLQFFDGMRNTKGEGQDREYVVDEEDENGKPIKGHWEVTGDKVRRDKEKEGKTYSDFSDKDYIASLFSLYNVIGQSDSKVYKAKNNYFYKIAVPIRVPAEKSMFSLIKMPVMHCINDEGKLTNTAFDKIYNRIETEFNRIAELHNELLKLGGKEPQGHNRIEEWNTGKKRGLALFQTSLMVGDLKQVIEHGATDENFKLSDIKDKLRIQLDNYFSNQINEMAQRMVKEGMMDYSDGEYENNVSTPGGEKEGLVPSYLFDGLDSDMNEKLYLRKDNFISNLSQVYMNAFINTSLINNILHGDESKLYKDFIDIVKRESGTMATGPSIEGTVACPEMGIDTALKEFYHLTYLDETAPRSLPGSTKPLEVDDGHGVCTDKGYLYMLYGKGTLNGKQAELLNNLRNGKLVSAGEFFNSGGLKSNGAFNSLKMVYNDGQVYLKFSVTPLFKDLTSIKGNNGKWIPKPGQEKLHALRERLEKFESDNNTVAIGHPISSSKMLTRNVYEGEYEKAEDSHFEKLQTKFMKEQLQNPSGKTEITDPTQPKLQLSAEQDLTAPSYYQDGTGKKYTVGQTVKVFLDNVAKRLSNNFIGARDSLFSIDQAKKSITDSIEAGKVTPQLSNFLKIAKDNLEATGTDAQMLGFLDSDINGQPIYNINFPSLLPKITSIFFSYFSRGVLREVVPGMSLAIVSPAHGMGIRVKEVKSVWTNADIKKYKADINLLGQPREWATITDAQYKRDPNTYKNAIKWSNPAERTFIGLDELLKKGTVHVLDDLRDNYLEFKNNKPIGYFSEALRSAHNREEMLNGFTDENRYSFGTRIPYVDKNSATSFKFVDQLSVQMGSVIVVPREYYERTGADNDIDKDYVSMPDTYIENGKRVKYGTATSPEGKFEEYKIYQLENNEKVKDLYHGDKFYSNDEVGTTLLDKKGVTDLTSEVNDKRLIEVLRELKLPSNTKEFILSGGENLNNGVLNNRILDSKIAMLNNDSTVKNQNTPTTTDPLKAIIGKPAKNGEVATGLIAELQDGESDFCKNVIKMMTEQNVDTNSFLGMVNDRSATMMGADSIGSVATTNIVYSFFNHMRVSLRNNEIIIDGKTFDNFKQNFAWDKESGIYKNNPATRIFAALACLTNTMTDNPKERNANKLNLGKTATGFAAYLIATGMPEKTAYLYMIQPSAFKYTELKKGGVLKLADSNNSASGYLSSRIKELQDKKVEPKSLTSDDLIENIKNGGSDETIELSVLQDIQKMEKQSETYFKVARILRLTQGIKGDMGEFDRVISDLHDLGINIENGKMVPVSDETFKDMSACVDIRKELLSGRTFMSSILDAVNQINSCMPGMFIERTKLFQNMTKGAKTSLVPPISPLELEKFDRDVNYDLLSYIGVRAYKYFLDSTEMNNSLNNSLIYPGKGYPTIVEQSNKLKTELGAVGINNYLLSYFLVPGEASDKTGGIDILEANTWAQLSEKQQNQLIGSFVDLYQDAYKTSNIFTHDFAKSMFNYLLVKDGGQFSNGSFIRMLPPFIFKDMMDKIGAANELMKGGEGSYEQLFGKGVTQQSLLNDFIKGYTTHVANRRFVLKVKRSSKTKKLINQVNREVTINALEGIREYGDNKTGNFTENEKAMLGNNKNALKDAGFTLDRNGINFPLSFQYNNRLYALKEVYRRSEDDSKWKPVLSDVFIQSGEFAPTGLKAKYTETKWKGSPKQFPAAAAVGDVPEYTHTEKEVEKIARDTKNINNESIIERMKQDGYHYSSIDHPTMKKASGEPIPKRIVVNKNNVPILGKGGQTIGNFIDAYNVLQENKKTVPLTKKSTSVNKTIDWNEEIKNIYLNKKTIVDKTQFKQEALNLKKALSNRVDVNGKHLSDEEILNKLKECL